MMHVKSDETHATSSHCGHFADHEILSWNGKCALTPDALVFYSLSIPGVVSIRDVRGRSSAEEE